MFVLSEDVNDEEINDVVWQLKEGLQLTFLKPLVVATMYHTR